MRVTMRVSPTERRRLAVRAGLVLLAVSASAPAPGQSRAVREAVRDVIVAAREKDPTGFLVAARKAIAKGDRKAVEEVVERFGDLVETADFGPEFYYRFHNDAVRLLAKSDQPEAVVELKRQLERSRRWQSRLLVLDVASLNPGLDVLESAFKALDDKAPQVVRRSLKYLRHIDTAFEEFNARLAALDRVLERYLEIDDDRKFRGGEWDRTRLAFATALKGILEVSLATAVDYQNYLSARRDRSDLFDPVEARGDGSTRVTLFGTEVTGKNIAFVIDVSGSMLATDKVKLEPPPETGRTVVRGSKEERELIRERIESRRRITRARRELAKVVRALPDDIRFNIVAYSSDVRPWKKELVACSDKNRKAALEYIEKLEAAGVTVTDLAIEEAFADLDVDTVFLITDGAPTHIGASGRDRPTDADTLIRVIHERVRVLNFLRDVRIFTLGFPDAEEEFLKRLSGDNSGTYAPIR